MTFKKLYTPIICLALGSCHGVIVEKAGFVTNKAKTITTPDALSDNSPFALESPSMNLARLYGADIAERILTSYDKQLNKILESEYDGKTLSHSSEDKKLRVKIELKDSFKITQENMYCREYFQTITYLDKESQNQAVACRVKPNKWKNIIIKN